MRKVRFLVCFSTKDLCSNCYLLAKDLSHVPCKFFKVGGCTAGASCPFSHIVPEPGQKEVCTWFVKGNCKFGHKCALAHILPGQTMAMDRKNKKAAQTAASASGEKNKTGGKKKDAGGSGANKLPLLTGGSTAPTRILNSSSSGSSKSGRPPISMSLKATISPSAPAPPLQDTDFASFAAFDHLDLAPQDEDESPVSGSKRGDPTVDLPRPMTSTTSVDLVSVSPSSRPSTTTRINDFGPIGSPPTYRFGQPISPIRTNGSTASPATSPRNQSHMINHGSPSHNGPLSAPGNHEYFVSSSFSTRGPGIPASLGSGLAMKSGRRGFDDPRGSGDIGPNSFSGLLSTHLSQNSGTNGLDHGEYDITIEYENFSGAKRIARKGMETAVEDEELEDFLPSSLNDLLTPEERSRRMSRSNSGQKSGISALASANHGMEQLASRTSAGQTEVPTGGNGNTSLGHRYSHSVPAPTLLADIKSIWSDPSMSPVSSSPLRVGIPSATIPTTLGSSNAHADDAALSMSMGSVGGGTPSSLTMISPSNASAAFLPGLHKHYLDAKAKQAQQAQLGHTTSMRAAGLRGASNPIYANNGVTSGNSLASSYLQPLGAVGLPSSVSNSSNLHMHIHGNMSTTYRTTPSPFDLTQTLHQPQPHAARPISNLTAQASKLDDPLLAPTLLSPGSRALHSHAPGQSLPQGLAAGYSRIHALPSLTNVTSPSSGSFITGSPGGGSEGLYGEWPTTAGPSHQQGVANTIGGHGSVHPNPGLDSMFSRLSYAATTRSASGGHAGALSGAPPGLTRNVSGGKYNHPLSPLSGPVTTRDDDILFDMDK